MAEMDKDLIIVSRSEDQFGRGIRKRARNGKQNPACRFTPGKSLQSRNSEASAKR